MRLVIDMQGLQTGSRHRGIGRYTQSLVKAMLRDRKDLEIYLLLNGLFSESIEPIVNEFSGLVPPEFIKVWNAIGPTSYADPSNEWRMRSANFMRSQRLLQLAPDMVLLTTLFEGFGDNFTASIDEGEGSIPVATILYDLIPLLNPNEYLADKRVRQWYERHLEVLKKSRVLLAISESSRKEAIDLLDFAPDKVINISSSVDDQFKPEKLTVDEENQLRREFGLHKEYLMYSGATDPRKNHLRLIQAYANLPKEIKNCHQLAIVGGMPNDHEAALRKEAERCGLTTTDCRILGRVDDQSLVRLYALCKGYVFPSWHEGFGLPALEAMRCGRPVIASNASSLPEVVGDEAALFDPFNVDDITARIAQLLTDQTYRDLLVKKQSAHAKKFSWESTAKIAIETIVRFIEQDNNVAARALAAEEKPDYQELAKQLRPKAQEIEDCELRLLAKLLAEGEQDSLQIELLLDISELVKHDAHTGIQRVTRAILKEITEICPPRIKVRPVYATTDHGYRYAHVSLSGINQPFCDTATEEPIRGLPGDVFIGLDLIHPEIAEAQRELLAELKKRRVLTLFVVYDLIPILYPQFANDSVPEGHKNWLDVVTEADGAICISKNVAKELQNWMQKEKPGKASSFMIEHFNLGADIENSLPTRGVPLKDDVINSALKLRPSYLMVGTLEPRKGYRQAIEAFNLLWAQGHDVNLVVIGKPGWKADGLFDEIQKNREINNRLFWLQNASDECLDNLYMNSTALIAASYCEGYGLPIIEAARRQLPIIARDIPIFREVAQCNAYFFQDSTKPGVLAKAVEDWQKNWKNGDFPRSENIKCLTWKESAEEMLNVINRMTKISRH